MTTGDDGRYRLREELGRGGMSVVWRAHDEVLARDVAVKVLTPSCAEDPDLRRRIQREARSAAQLSHPNIVDVHDYGETGDEPPRPYVVMELLAGRSLADVVSGGALPWRVAVSVCAQVGAALAAAHRRGVVHRDVTPGNVMVTPEGVKLVDFGISAAIGEADSHAPGQVYGTPAYLAPERVDGGPVRPATDVYALGLLLYKALTGRLPWRTSTTTEMIAAHRYVDPAPLPAIRGLPPEIVDLCQQCLAKDPEARPTAGRAAATLALASAHAGPSASKAPSSLVAPVASLATLLRPDDAGPGAEAGADPGSAVAIVRPALATTVGITTPQRVLSRWPLPAPRVLAAAAAVGAMILIAGLTNDLPGRAGGRTPASAGIGPTPTAPPVPACHVRYEVRQHRGGEFAARITLTNESGRSIDGWQLEFELTADQRLVRAWHGTGRQDGATVSLYGEALPAGGSVTTGFDGVHNGVNPLPTTYLLNGDACQPALVATAGESGASTSNSGKGKGGGSGGDDDD